MKKIIEYKVILNFIMYGVYIKTVKIFMCDFNPPYLYILKTIYKYKYI